MSITGEAVVPLRRNHDFIRLWVGAGLSRFGSCVAMVAYPMLVLWHTGSPSAAGWVAFAASLPNFVVQLPAGALVDRWDRRRLMLWADVLGLLAALSVAVAVSLGVVWVPHLMLAAFAEVSLGIFYQLAERATVRNVVPGQQLPAALAQNEARGSAVGLLGQPVSGALFALARWLPFAFTAVANVVAVGCLLLIRRSFPAGPARARQPLHVDIRQGFGWLWQRRFLRVMTAVFAGSNLLFQIQALTVLFIVHRSGGSPAVLGLVTALGGLGGVLGALTAPWWSRRLSIYAISVFGHLGWTVLMPLVAFSEHPLALAGGLAGVSYVAGLFNVVAGVYQVRVTPDELQGRVNGTSRFLSAGASALGALAGGYLLAATGAGGAGFVVGGAALLLTLVVATSRTVRAEAHPSPS